MLRVNAYSDNHFQNILRIFNFVTKIPPTPQIKAEKIICAIVGWVSISADVLWYCGQILKHQQHWFGGVGARKGGITVNKTYFGQNSQIFWKWLSEKVGNSSTSTTRYRAPTIGTHKWLVSLERFRFTLLKALYQNFKIHISGQYKDVEDDTFIVAKMTSNEDYEEKHENDAYCRNDTYFRLQLH